MKLKSVPSLAQALPRAAPVIWCFAEGARAQVCDEHLPATMAARIKAWIAASRFDGAEGKVALVPLWLENKPSHVVLAGLGAAKMFKACKLERAAATVVRALNSSAIPALAFCAAPPRPGPTSAENAALITRGAMDGRYQFLRYRTPASDGNGPKEILFASPPRDRAAVLKAAQGAVAEGQVLNDVRELANWPGNEINPVTLAAEVRKLARKYGVSCTVMDEKTLARRACAGLLAVGRGSRTPPRMIRLAYPGTRRGAAPIVLIGKAVTFDSGGISLKPGKGMEMMKYDKCGAMAVLAAILIAARNRQARPVVAYLAAAENMPGGNAQRPGDLIRYPNGKSVDVINTDAEGRLILADALLMAADEKPAAVVDLATLTGAVIIALGHHAAAVLGTDETLAKELQAGGETCGERLWPLPLWPEYDAGIKSPFADLQNVGDGSAGTIVGAAFLKAFAPEQVPWAHLDIAGVAWQEKDQPHRAAGATLFGARLLTAWMNNK